MSDFAVIAHEPGDAGRAATIIGALRTAGVQVRGDKPVAEPIDVETAKAIDLAWLVVALWSRTSTDRDGSQALFHAAEVPAQRGSYLGVLLDGSAVPFGFGGLDTIDLNSWGGDEKSLAPLVEKIKRRMASGPSGGGVPEVETAAEAQEKRKRSLFIGGGAAAAVVLALIFWFAFGRTPPSARDAVDATLAAIPCSWLKVDPVDDGSHGLLAITGVADNPKRAGDTITGLVKDARVTTDRIAQINSSECDAIDAPRKLRQDDGGRLRVVSNDVGQDQNNRLAEARVLLNFRSEDTSMALFGIEPSGKVTWILPDYAMLDLLKTLDVGLVHELKRRYEFTLRADHLGWTGLLLVTGDRPLPNNRESGTVVSSQEFGKWLASATDHGTWHTEMTWYRIQSR